MPTIPEAMAIALEHHRCGRLQAAEQIYRQILQVQPNQAESIHLLGVVAHQVGKHEIAADWIRRAIHLKGNVADFHNNLANVLLALGNVPEAMACYRRSLELKPDAAETHVNFGNILRNQGDLEGAAACYRRALELRPDFAEGHNNLGNALNDQGKLETAIGCYGRALALRPDFVEAHNNLGNALKGQGKFEAAIVCYRRALELAPDLAEAYDNLGNVYMEQGKPEEAIACYRQAIKLKPDFAKAHNNLGNVLLNRGSVEAAIASYGRALELRPGFAKAHNNLGNAFKEQGSMDAAITCYRRALELSPTVAETHNNLGLALRDQGKQDEAAACYRRAIELKPDLAEAYRNLAVAFKDQAKSNDAIDCYRRALELEPDFVEAHSNLVYTLLFHPESTPPAIFQECRRWHDRHAAPFAKLIQSHRNDRSPDRRLRIGYASPDFREHCQAFFTVPLFSSHDHEAFEIICYSDAARPDRVTERLRSYSDAWRDITRLSDEQLAELIREDRIDILVDLTMHMAHNRLLAFARKPAPVQVCWLAYPGTTGLWAIDYRLTDPQLDPPGINDAYYSEESIQLPDTFWCYDPLEHEPAVNPLPAAEQGFITFGCLNNFCKINPFVLHLWARVLQAVERSRLVILAGEGSHRQKTLEVIATEGVSPERVTFLSKQPRPRYLSYYGGIDIALDTVPYNGHTTSLDAFWMGVPVVTLVGSTVVGRAGLSQLTNLGLPELVAFEPEQYVQIAAELAQDQPRLNALRSSLRARMMASPLMDGPRFARNVEAAYRRIWQRWAGRQPPPAGR